jgi:ABC-type polysaccharide/polyol phosphate export permease
VPANDLRTLWRYRGLVRRLVSRDLRVKYKGSTLGFAWSLLHPLVMAAVYTVAFRYVLQVRTEHFPAFLMSGLLPWMFFSSAVVSATGSVVEAGGLVRKVAFPRAALPVAAVATQFAQFVLMYAVIVPFVGLLGPGLDLRLVALVPIVAMQLVFVLGVGLALSAWHVQYRDVRHLADVAMQVWFWLTPVVYPAALVPERVRAWLWANPMAVFVMSCQDLVVRHRLPDPLALGAMFAFAATAVAIGWRVFERRQRGFPELV